MEGDKWYLERAEKLKKQEVNIDIVFEHKKSNKEHKVGMEIINNLIKNIFYQFFLIIYILVDLVVNIKISPAAFFF